MKVVSRLSSILLVLIAILVGASFIFDRFLTGIWNTIFIILLVISLVGELFTSHWVRRYWNSENQRKAHKILLLFLARRGNHAIGVKWWINPSVRQLADTSPSKGEENVNFSSSTSTQKVLLPVPGQKK